MALIWYFSTMPSIRLLAENDAMITVAFAHAGVIREPCRKLSNEELDDKLHTLLNKVVDGGSMVILPAERVDEESTSTEEVPVEGCQR